LATERRSTRSDPAAPPRAGRFESDVRLLAALLCLTPLGRAAAQQPADVSASILGRVVAEGGPAIRDAVVVVDSGRQTRTDPNGLFRFDSLSTGTHQLQVRAIGFTPLAAKIELFGGAADAVITLPALAQSLPQVSVTSRRQHLVEVGYYQRKATERARFLETDTLIRLDSLSLLRALSRLPGFRFKNAAALDPDVASNACGGFTLWANGWLVPDEDKAFFLRATHTWEVDAVEIYEEATAPLAFQDVSRKPIEPCVLAIWDW
jgi:hypothetical protein